MSLVHPVHLSWCNRKQLRDICAAALGHPPHRLEWFYARREGVKVRIYWRGVFTGAVIALIIASGRIGNVFTFLRELAKGFVTVFDALDGAGIIGLLIVIGFALVHGRRWSENARGRKEADQAWRRRVEYRGGKSGPL